MDFPLPANFPLPDEVSEAPDDSEIVEAPSGELNDDEYGFMLDTLLKPIHRKNASIVAFIESFVRCKNIRQASEESGVHESLGYKYRHRKDIANAIQKIIDKSVVKHGFDTSEVMERAKEMVDFDPADLQNPDGTWKDTLLDIPARARRWITEIEAKNLYQESEDINGIKTQIIVGKIIKYKWDKKAKYIELVGREKEMFKTTTRVEHDVTKDMKAVLLGQIDRAEKLTGPMGPPDVETIDYNVKENE